jgi:hypothetical protein
MDIEMDEVLKALREQIGILAQEKAVLTATIVTLQKESTRKPTTKP